MGIYVIYGPKRKWLINHLSFEPSFQCGSKLKNGPYGNCFLCYRISKLFKTVGHYHWDYQITLHWSQEHEQKYLYMAHLYILHGAGIWNPTFALVQNHSQSCRFFYVPAPWETHMGHSWTHNLTVPCGKPIEASAARRLLVLDDLFCLRHRRR